MSHCCLYFLPFYLVCGLLALCRILPGTTVFYSNVSPPCRAWHLLWRSAYSWVSTACCPPASSPRMYKCCGLSRATKHAQTPWTSELDISNKASQSAFQDYHTADVQSVQAGSLSGLNPPQHVQSVLSMSHCLSYLIQRLFGMELTAFKAMFKG